MVSKEKLEKCIQKVIELKRDAVRYDGQERKNVESRIRLTIREIFGEESQEFKENEFLPIRKGSLNTNDSPDDRQRQFQEGIPEVIKLLNYLKDRLQERESENQTANILTPNNHLGPIGSPFGFDEDDWNTVFSNKDNKNTLFVTLGYQFESNYYDSETLISNIKVMMKDAVDSLKTDNSSLTLQFKSLSAGYGEHLFNQIVRDIIGADITIFETSDRNPNVMIEMGVALTWGIPVFPIFNTNDDISVPTDISGQTYAKYKNNAENWDDPKHSEKIRDLIRKSVRRKQKDFRKNSKFGDLEAKSITF